MEMEVRVGKIWLEKCVAGINIEINKHFIW